MPVHPSPAILRALDRAAQKVRAAAAANPQMIERGEGPSPELMSISQLGFGQATASSPAVIEAPAIMNENLRTLIDADIMQAHEDVLRANHPQVTNTSTLGTFTGTLRMEDLDRAMRQFDATPQITGIRLNLQRSYMYGNTTTSQEYVAPTDPEAVAKALGVVEDQTLAALRKLKQLGWVWDGKDWVYRTT